MQRALVGKGFDLPIYGVDSDFGHETRLVLQRFARLRGLAWDPDDPVPAALLDALELEPEQVQVIPPGGEVVDLEGVDVYDLRREQADPHPKSKRDRKTGKTLRRDPVGIDAIVLHQTAVSFPGASQQLARRSLRIACHAMAFRSGFLAWPVEPLWYIHHADRLNARSLGLEVEGLFPGRIGGKVRNPPATRLGEAQIHAARMGVKLLVEEGRRAGCPIEFIFAHRQSDSWRRADPGEELWRRVALEYAIPVLKLVPRQRETFPHPKGPTRRGLPVPLEWDPDGDGKY